MSYSVALRKSVLRDLEAVHAVRGSVPRALVRDVAREIGCSASTVWTWWKRYRDEREIAPSASQSAELPDAVIEVIFAYGGNVSAAYRELMANPETAAITPPRRTLAYRWRRSDAALRGYATGGAEGLMDQQMRARHNAEERNQLWRVDHQEFPVWVLPAGRASAPVKPWVTTVIDDATRTIMSVLVTVERPDATTTAVALADAMRLKPTTAPGVMVGGVPLAVYSDNGGEFKSGQFQGMLRRLGIGSERSFPYMKHQNGKAERVQQTMQHELAHRLPGWAHGPKTLRLKDVFALDGELLSEELLSGLIVDWVDRYNTERPHQSLGGDTPLQAWASSHTPLREPDMELVRLAMMPTARERTVTPAGISVGGQDYTSGELARLRLVGRKVDVRYLPHDASFIEVFDGEKWLCTCYPAAKLSAEDRALMAAVSKEQYRTARAFQEAARERRALAVATATPEDPKMQPLSTPRAASLADGDEELLALSEAEPSPSANGGDAAVVDVDHHVRDPWELERPPLPDEPFDGLDLGGGHDGPYDNGHARELVADHGDLP